MIEPLPQVKDGKIVLEEQLGGLLKSYRRAALSEGCYMLRTNINDWSGEELWKAYPAYRSRGSLQNTQERLEDSSGLAS